MESVTSPVCHIILEPIVFHDYRGTVTIAEVWIFNMDYSTCSSYIISKDVTCKYDGTPVALDHEGGNILEFIVNVSVIKFCVRIDNLSEKVSSNPGVSNALFKLYESLFVI